VAERSAWADALIDSFCWKKCSTTSKTSCYHRAEWLRIPLTGMLRILSEPASETLLSETS